MKEVDMRIHPRDLKMNDIFYECEYGKNMKMIVTEKPALIEGDRNKWAWKAMCSNGYIYDYLITEGLEHYGPKIYSVPEYYEG
jgi:hypothetical protein